PSVHGPAPKGRNALHRSGGFAMESINSPDGPNRNIQQEAMNMSALGRAAKQLGRVGVALAAALAFIVAVAAFAFAHGGDDNVIHACYRTERGSGQLRLVQGDQQCKKNENAIQWNITGPPGPPGPQGPKGDTG